VLFLCYPESGYGLRKRAERRAAFRGPPARFAAPVPQDADAQLLKAARQAAVACQFEIQLERPDSPDHKKIDPILTDIRTRLGEPEPEAKPLEPGMKSTLDKLEKNWTAQPHRRHDRSRGR